MTRKQNGLGLTKDAVAALFADPKWDRKFPPLLDLELAVELIRGNASTVYQWRSQGLLDGCSEKVGKKIIFVRDLYVMTLLNGGLNVDEHT